jgi:hypothetical protein
MKIDVKLYGSIIWTFVMLAPIIVFAIQHDISNYEILLGLILLLTSTIFVYYMKLYSTTFKNKNKNSIAKLALAIQSMIILSYYLTRWKLINGPFNYSTYFAKPIIKFKSIYKTPL